MAMPYPPDEVLDDDETAWQFEGWETGAEEGDGGG
jgi:hypothetical protein